MKNSQCSMSKDCSYYSRLTESVLRKVLKMMKEGSFAKLVDGYEQLIENMLEKGK